MTVLTVLLAAVFMVQPQPLQTPDLSRIEEVRVSGNRRIPTETINYNLQTKPGDQLDKDVIRRDIKGLYALGHFAIIKMLLAEKGHQDATVTATTEDIPPGAIAVTFKVDEGPKIRIQKITIEGNKALSSRQIKDAMKVVKEAGPLTVFTGNAINPNHLDRNFVGPVTGTQFGIHEKFTDFKFTIGRTF